MCSWLNIKIYQNQSLNSKFCYIFHGYRPAVLYSGHAVKFKGKIYFYSFFRPQKTGNDTKIEILRHFFSSVLRRLQKQPLISNVFCGINIPNLLRGLGMSA